MARAAQGRPNEAAEALARARALVRQRSASVGGQAGLRVAASAAALTG